MVGELPAISAAMMDRRRASVAMSPPVGAAMISRRANRHWGIWLAILLVVGALGGSRSSTRNHGVRGSRGLATPCLGTTFSLVE